jgi:hypothetical protein
MGRFEVFVKLLSRMSRCIPAYSHQFIDSADNSRWPHPSIHKFGTKFRREVADAQSIYFACWLRATKFSFYSQQKKNTPLLTNICLQSEASLRVRKATESGLDDRFAVPANGPGSLYRRHIDWVLRTLGVKSAGLMVRSLPSFLSSPNSCSEPGNELCWPKV